jgi:Gas vesicle synthesis protein GvpL/GvpF
MLYVYAFVATPASVPDLAGIDGAVLGTEAVNGLEAVISRHDSAPRASEEAIVAHAQVVDALVAENEAVVPVRFGAVHADLAEFRSAVGGRGADLEEALGRVRGSVELGLRALAPPATPDAPESGADYMRARLERRRSAEQLAAELHAPLAALARETTQTVAATPRLLFSAAYLVPEPQVRAFRTEVERMQAAHPELGLVCTGPWPPYSFVTAEGNA